MGCSHITSMGVNVRSSHAYNDELKNDWSPEGNILHILTRNGRFLSAPRIKQKTEHTRRRDFKILCCRNLSLSFEFVNQMIWFDQLALAEPLGFTG